LLLLEVIEFRKLLALCHTQIDSADNPDGWWQGLGNNGIFSVKSFYEKILVRREQAFPCNVIWTPKVP